MDTVQQEVSDEQIYHALKEYQSLGVLQYVLPTEPLGKQWILGVEGEIVKLTSKAQAAAFLAGAGAVARFLAARKVRGLL